MEIAWRAITDQARTKSASVFGWEILGGNFIVRLQVLRINRIIFLPSVDFPEPRSSIGWKRGEE